jgi:hypothetical protein
MAEFYLNLPEIDKTEWKFSYTNEKISFWIYFEEGTILMIENKPINKAPEAIVFKLPDKFNIDKTIYSSYLTNSIHKTEFSFYLKDPDGNTIGFSSYPNKLTDYFKG